METKDIRRKNLKILLDNNNVSQASFAMMCGLMPSMISQLVNGHRNLGDSLARKIEERLSIQRGWFDIPHRVSVVAEGEEPTETERVQEASLSPQESLLIELFRKMPESEKESIVSTLKEKAEGYERLLNELLALKNSITAPK